MSKGFSPIGIVILIAIILITSLGVYLSKNYNLSFNISKKDTQSETATAKHETEEIPTTNLQDMTCGYLGFADVNDGEYSVFSHPNLYKYGKLNFSEKLSLENTEKVKHSLRQVMDKIPPEHNPEISVCFTSNDRFILVDDKKANLIHLDAQYNILKIIQLNNFTPIYDFIAYTPERLLYIKQSSKDYDNGKMTDAVLKINLNNGNQQLLNYSERVESVGVPQKNSQNQTTTMTSKNLGITFTAPADVTATYNPLFDQAIEYFYFRKGDDELEVMLGQSNPYCKEQEGGYFKDKKAINVAGRWTINKVNVADPRSGQLKYAGEAIIENGVCLSFKETINTDNEMEKVFDEILTTAKQN